MKKRGTLSALGGVAAIALLVGFVHGGEQREAERSGIRHVSATEAEFVEVVPGVSKAVLWGDHDRGPYGAFTRFAPDTDNGMHVHTHDVRLVVLEGAYLYRDKAGERRVGAGEFLLIPGGKKHWSGGDAQQGALFYEESAHAFDLLPVE